MRTTRRALGAASIALASILVLSCNNDFGIFANVQDEREQSGTKVFQKTQVSNAFRFGTKYYAATSTLNTRAAGASEWKEVGGLSTTTLRGAVLTGDSATGTIYALVEADGTQTIHSSTDGATWTGLTGPTPPSLSGSQTFALDALFATSTAPGQLYVEAHIYDSSTGTSMYSLYHYDGSAFMLVGGFAPAANKTIRGVVDDGSSYWFASEDLLFSGSSADGSDAVDASAAFTGLSGRSIWGITAIGASVYISTKDGELYRSGTAASTKIASVPLTCVVEVPGAAGNIILVGTDALGSDSAEGYFEGTFGSLASGSTNTQVASNKAVFDTTVGNFPVHAFYYDPAAATVFICVSPGISSAKYYGLYSSVWNGSTWSGWSAE